MRKSSKKFLAITPLLLLPLTSQAEEKTYMGLTYLQAYYKETGANFNNSLLGIRIGSNFSDNIGAEFFAAGSVNNASFYYGSTYITSQVQNAYGAHIKLRTTPSNGFSGYVRLGVVHGTVSASSAYASGWASGTSGSYGAGVEFDMGKSAFLQLDYSSYYTNSDVTVSGPSITIGTRF